MKKYFPQDFDKELMEEMNSKELGEYLANKSIERIIKELN